MSTAGVAPALDPDRAPTQHRLQRWQAQDGLPQSVVRAIAQDASGYLWLGTQEGLVRFDGLGFRVYDEEAVPGLRSRWVLAIQPTTAGLWLGTNGGGLARLGGDAAPRAWTGADGLPNDSVIALLTAREGGLWVGTRGGLARLADGRVDAAPCAGLGDGPVLTVVDDGGDGVLVATVSGLFRCAGGAATFVALEGELVRSVLPLRGGGGLLAGTDHGLRRLEPDGRLWTSHDGLPNDIGTRLLEDRDGNVWVGTDGGLARWRDGRVDAFPADHPLGRLPIRALFEDREGSLWVGTDGGGVFRLDDAAFALIGEEEGLRPAATLTVFEDAAGTLWAGSEDGLFRLVAGRAERVRDAPVDGRFVWTLAEAPPGRLWVGSDDGLWSLERGRWRRWPGLAKEDVRVLYVDRVGGLWAGSDFGGLDRLDGDRFVSALPPATAATSVWSLQEDGRGGLWIGTAATGLQHRAADGALERVGAAAGLESEAVTALHVDPDGTVWVGTPGQGLYRGKDGRFFRFDRGRGLPDSFVHQILDDGRGSLYLGSNRGIARVARSELEAVAEGRRERLEATFFDRAAGLEVPETNGGNFPAALRSRDGRLWFSTMAGVAVLDPEKPRTNGAAPLVVVEELRADDQVVVPGSGPLPARTRRVEVRLAVLSFRAPEEVRVRYRLLGFDPGWIELGASQRSISFTNLPPGRLELEVEAINEDGVVSREPSRLAFSRSPLFHETVWFRPAVALALVLAVGGAYRLRLGQMRARFQAVLDERARLGRELHDTIAQSLSAVGMQVEAAVAFLGRDRDRAAGHLARAGELLRSSHDEVRRSIRALRPAALERLDLGSALETEARDAGERYGVPVEVRRRGRPRMLPPEVETEVLRIGQEAVTNALRHGQPSKVEVTIAWERRRLGVEVRDDGAGFDPAAPRRPRATGGFGLDGMGERATKIGAKLRVDSRPGTGTRVALDLPLGGRGGEG